MNLNYIESKITVNYNNFLANYLRKIRWLFMCLRMIFIPSKNDNSIENMVFIIWTQKWWTTSLYNYLIQYTNVCDSVYKETNFYWRNWWRKSHVWFRANFPFSIKERICIDASPDYLNHPLAPKRIHIDYPNAKFIVLLREPKSRLISQFKMEKSRIEKIEEREVNEAILDDIAGFESLIELNSTRIDKDRDLFKKYIFRWYWYRGLYHKHLKNRFNYFDPSQFYIWFSEDLKYNTENELRNIEKFLWLNEEKIDITRKHEKKMSETLNIDSWTKEKMEEYFHDDSKKLRNLLWITPKW